ncbi:MAG TPA: hypothetical protein VNV44_11700 [Solirubrobacteraceae bacterium]|jgi:hypothetical protein|nr:hypothetical protein [Solirubrobacteraceae bacterium]
MSSFLEKNVKVIRAGLDDHNANCPVPARAILLHPSEHAKLDVPTLWGHPVLADERVRLGFFRIDCEASAWGIERELALHIESPAKVPLRVLDPVESPLAARASQRV